MHAQNMLRLVSQLRPCGDRVGLAICGQVIKTCKPFNRRLDISGKQAVHSLLSQSQVRLASSTSSTPPPVNNDEQQQQKWQEDEADAFKHLDDFHVPDPFHPDYATPQIKKYLAEESKHNGKLIYVGKLTSQLKRAKLVSLTSSVLGVLLLPFLQTNVNNSSMFAQVFVYGTMSFFVFVTPLFGIYMSRRYVSRIYYNYETRTCRAVLINFFMREYTLEFAIDDLYVPELPGAFTTAKLKSSQRNLFIDLEDINDIDLVQKIYGYDKPIDIQKYYRKSNGRDNEQSSKN